MPGAAKSVVANAGQQRRHGCCRASDQIPAEKFNASLPRQGSSLLVITRRRIVVKSVIGRRIGVLSVLFRGCVECHGSKAEGLPGKTPPLTIPNDWYLFGQLENFRRGIRSTLPSAPHVLANEESERDVIAHINALSK